MRKPTGIIIFTLLFLILSISCSSLLYTNTKKQAGEYVLIWSTDNDGSSGKYNSYNEMNDLDKEYAITAFSYLTSSNDIKLGGNNNGYQLGLLSAPIKV